MSQLQHRNKNQSFILNFAYQFIKKTKNTKSKKKQTRNGTLATRILLLLNNLINFLGFLNYYYDWDYLVIVVNVYYEEHRKTNNCHVLYHILQSLHVHVGPNRVLAYSLNLVIDLKDFTMEKCWFHTSWPKPIKLLLLLLILTKFSCIYVFHETQILYYWLF